MLNSAHTQKTMNKYTGYQRLKSYMKSGYLLTIQRLGHWQLTWDGVDNEDTSWRLVSSWPSHTVPQWEVFISIGPDLRVKKTITLSERLNELIIWDTARHTSCPFSATDLHHLLPENHWKAPRPVPCPCFLVIGFRKRCSLSPQRLGARLTSERTCTGSSAESQN